MNTKFKDLVIEKGGVVKRLLHYHSLSDTTDLNERDWYKNANAYCVDLSLKFNVPLFKVAGVCAALSPQKNWQENKKLLLKFLCGYTKNMHTKAQINKAVLCMISKNEEEVFSLLSKDGKKTSQFYYNILKPTIPCGVTIDRHAIGSCLYPPTEIQTVSVKYATLTKAQYIFFEDCFKEAAEIKGMLPHEFQAIIWSTFRRLKNLPKEYRVS